MEYPVSYNLGFSCGFLFASFVCSEYLYSFIHLNKLTMFFGGMAWSSLFIYSLMVVVMEVFSHKK